MGDYYQQYLTSMAGVGGNMMASPLEIHAPAIAGIPIHIGNGAGTLQSPYPATISYFPTFPESAHYPPKVQKGRRKPALTGPDHVKHRRTRSGCYTCRSRRVKCDEAHPICERCKKGQRECVYPDPPNRKQSSTGPTRGSQPPSPATSTDEVAEMDVERESQLEAIPDVEDEDEEDWATELPTPSDRTRRISITSMATSWRQDARRSSETPSQDDHSRGSPAPSTTTSSSHTAYPPSPANSRWAYLQPDMRQHLDYFCENITHYHYCMSSDVDDFFRLTLPGLAVHHEALLHAVIGFSAYHSTLRDPNGKIDVFLRHFNRSVQLLIDVFRSKGKPNVGTLLTILQLAMIEEYLGDWINLLGHQKAALEIMMDLFTPETIMQTPLGRVIMLWYLRFDVFVALMGGFQTALPREWFDTMVEYYRQRSIAEPHNLRFKYAFISADLRLLSMELSLLIARSNKGTVTAAEYAAEHERITVRLEQWKCHMDPALTDPTYVVRDLASRAATPPSEQQQQQQADSIVNPFEVGVLFEPPLFVTTEMMAEWNSVMVMHKCQSPAIDRERLYTELAGHSYAIAQIYEAVELYPGTPKGAMMLIQAPLSIASLFLPHDAKHHAWLRRKFAVLEQMGYIATLATRTKLAELFQDPGCKRWWLPHDEGYTKVLQRVRQFADERNAVAVTAQAESIRDVRHIFSKLEINPTSPCVGSGEGGVKREEEE